jgi:SAM-dependent methyltransferase
VNPYWHLPDAQYHWDPVIASAEEDAVDERLGMFHDLNDYVDDSLAQGVVLDVGCGKPRFHDVYQAQHSSGFIHVDAVARYPKVIQANAADLPFNDELFSVVIACRMLSNVPTWLSRTRVLRELRRVLRDGGHLLLLDSSQDHLDMLNEERMDAGMEKLPPARTGSLPLTHADVCSALEMEIKSYPIALDYYAWTRYQFPFLNEGRFPIGEGERTPPEDFEANDRLGVQRIWVYEKV